MGEKTHPEVLFGREGKEVALPVIAQPHAMLTGELERFMARGLAIEGVAAVLDGAEPAEALGLLLLAGDEFLYDLLEVLIPDLPKRLSKHQFVGYDTVDAYEKGDKDQRSFDLCPTIPQLEEAFKTAIRVNRFDVFKPIGGFVKGLIGPKEKSDLKSWIQNQFSDSSPSSPGTNGASAPTSSGGPAPIAAPSAERPSGETEAGATPVALSGNHLAT